VEAIGTGVKGKTVFVPCERIAERAVVVSGRYLRVASVHDEELVEGAIAPAPETFVSKVKKSALRADVFTFPENIDQPSPKYDFPFEWDNVAVARTTSYSDWWEKKLPQETRKNVRRSAKKGVSVRVVAYDKEFVGGIKAIYDETPIRQGSRFWHYGKDLETVRRENGTYLERCEYIGAYFEEKLIGFMRFVYVGNAAKIMQILASVAHTDKRPMNAMIAKAVEVCQERGIAYLVYSKFRFGNKKNSPLAEFKRRNGFEEMLYPRYFVPLTLKGRIAVKFKLYRGLLGLLPPEVIDRLLRARTFLLQLRTKTAPPPTAGNPVVAQSGAAGE
jgi:hypothetical protein